MFGAILSRIRQEIAYQRDLAEMEAMDDRQLADIGRDAFRARLGVAQGPQPAPPQGSGAGRQDVLLQSSRPPDSRRRTKRHLPRLTPAIERGTDAMKTCRWRPAARLCDAGGLESCPLATLSVAGVLAAAFALMAASLDPEEVVTAGVEPWTNAALAIGALAAVIVTTALGLGLVARRATAGYRRSAQRGPGRGRALGLPVVLLGVYVGAAARRRPASGSGLRRRRGEDRHKLAIEHRDGAWAKSISFSPGGDDDGGGRNCRSDCRVRAPSR